MESRWKVLTVPAVYEHGLDEAALLEVQAVHLVDELQYRARLLRYTAGRPVQELKVHHRTAMVALQTARAGI
jgi:hypothetical protein